MYKILFHVSIRDELLNYRMDKICILCPCEKNWGGPSLSLGDLHINKMKINKKKTQLYQKSIVKNHYETRILYIWFYTIRTYCKAAVAILTIEIITAIIWYDKLVASLRPMYNNNACDI